MKTLSISLFAAFIISLVSLPVGATRPIDVNASDLIGKVYALTAPSAGRESCRNEIGNRFGSQPVTEGNAEWMSIEEGFCINYQGMQPEAEAMAQYKEGVITDYGYIFYFPYTAMHREEANGRQCEFCSALLNDLREMGITLGADPATENLFDVAGIYDGGHLRLILSESVNNETITDDLRVAEIPADREGEFILYMSIVPATATLTAEAF